jgi:hypothetical protein
MIAAGMRRIGPSLPETIAALADELISNVEQTELVAGIVVGILVLRGSGRMRSARWLWHLATREEMLASKAMLAADAGRTLAAIGREGADA